MIAYVHTSISLYFRWILAARWCVINDEEQHKCEDLVAAIAAREELGYPDGSPKYEDLPEFSCVRVNES